MLPVIWLVVSLVFLLIHLVPGDPILQMLGEGAPVTDVQAARHAYGLDLPLGRQYLNYWEGVLHGDLGTVVRFNQSVTRLIAQRYPYTLQLTLAALLVAMLLSVPAGVRSAQRRNRWDDRLLSVVSLFGLSFPNFALGPILILLFAIKLGWLRSQVQAVRAPGASRDHHGRRAGGDPYPHGAHLHAGRAGPGLHPHRPRQGTVRTHGGLWSRPAQCHDSGDYRAGLQFGALLAGAIVTETIFSWPGIGRLTIQAISNRDYYLVQGCILAIGLTYVAVNFLTDLLYSVANPRIRQ